MVRCMPPAGELGQGNLKLKITGFINFDEGTLAQTVKVKVFASENISRQHSPPFGTELVAKFYDPLYGSFDEVMAMRMDPFLLLDCNYAHEVQAYEHMKPIWGTTVPFYYGSYTAHVVVPRSNLIRPVRLVLMELIPGKTLGKLDPAGYSIRQRQAIIGSLIDQIYLVNRLDVIHSEFYPRNVMLASVDSEGKHADIRLIDFGRSKVGKLEPQGDLEKYKKLDFRTLMYRKWYKDCHVHPAEDFETSGWARDWDCEWNDWLHNRYFGSASDHFQTSLKIPNQYISPIQSEQAELEVANV
ncbi:MAG: hypothetical protein Q9159_002070 [Coniocarpon cinnabarinum]